MEYDGFSLRRVFNFEINIQTVFGFLHIWLGLFTSFQVEFLSLKEALISKPYIVRWSTERLVQSRMVGVGLMSLLTQVCVHVNTNRNNCYSKIKTPVSHLPTNASYYWHHISWIWCNETGIFYIYLISHLCYTELFFYGSSTSHGWSSWGNIRQCTIRIWSTDCGKITRQIHYLTFRIIIVIYAML